MRRTLTNWRSVWACAALSALAGMLLALAPLGAPFWRASYDLPLLGSSPAHITNAVIVYVDDESLRALGKRPHGALDRRWHAQLLDRLAADGARAAVFDLSFTEADPADAGDQAFAAALRRNGKAVLAAAPVIESWGTAERRSMRPPAPLFATNALAVGVASVEPDPDGVVRRGFRDEDALAWVALKAAQAFPPGPDLETDPRTMLRYYLPRNARSSAFNHVSLHTAVASNGTPRGFFRGQAVFIGSRSDVGTAAELRDRFATPFSVWDERYAPEPGVVLHATAFANVAREEWLTPLSPWLAALYTMACGLAGSLAICPRRRWWALVCFAGAMLVVAGSGVLLQQRPGVVTPWLIPALVQLPLALVWTLGNNSANLGKPKVFISYRRSDGWPHALLIYSELLRHGVNCWLDLRSMQAGKFDEQLLTQIGGAPSFLLVLTPDVLGERIGDPEDWVRKEIRHALKTGRHIIPVAVDCVMPKKDQLPEDIAELAVWHSFKYDRENTEETVNKILANLVTRRGRRRARRD